MRLRVALPLALALVVLAFVACAPASLVDRRLAAASDGRLRLSDAMGTVWHGSGAVTDARGAWRVPVAWRASPLAALKGTADVTLTPQGRVSANGGVTLADVRLVLPAAALGSALPAALAGALGGELRIDAPAFRFGDGPPTGALAVRWERARVVVGGAIVDLGTVDARVAPRGADLAGTVSSEGGALRVAGEFAWANGQIGVTATLTPTASLPPDVARALATLGPADASGAVRVTWRGTLR